MKLCCATNNADKLAEFAALIAGSYRIVSLAEIGCKEEIPEDFGTIEENSAQKAWYVHHHYSVDCFADDSGLEVEALGGAPGVHSAFFAGPQKSSADNVAKLLKELQPHTNRKARFRAVITLVQAGRQVQFEGRVEGRISHTPRGRDGFGYDPVFIPEGYDRTFAEIPLAEKNRISHRGKAALKLLDYLRQNQHSDRQ